MMFNTFVQGSSLPCTALYVPSPNVEEDLPRAQRGIFQALPFLGSEETAPESTSCTELLAGGGLLSLKS